MPAPTITPLPTPPSRSTDPTNFAIEADAFVAALPEFVTDANAQASYLDGVASAVDADAAAAAASAAAALTSENNAEAAADAAAATADVALWVSGTTYAIGDNVFSPINYQTYRRKTNGAGTTDPSLDSTNWQLLTFAVSTPLTVPGNSTAGAELRLGEDTDNGTNYVALKAPNSLASNLTFTLPTADGAAGTALATDGAGNLQFVAAGGADLQEFTTSGTWTKPSSAKFVMVEAWGAGGGGAGGRRSTPGNYCGGGTGGGGGAYNRKIFKASELPATVPIIIGAGGAGGLGATVDNTDGNYGGAGGNTTFGSSNVYLLARGGARGNITFNDTQRVRGGYGGQTILSATPELTGGNGFTVGGAFSTALYQWGYDVPSVGFAGGEGGYINSDKSAYQAGGSLYGGGGGGAGGGGNNGATPGYLASSNGGGPLGYTYWGGGGGNYVGRGENGAAFEGGGGGGSGILPGTPNYARTDAVLYSASDNKFYYMNLQNGIFDAGNLSGQNFVGGFQGRGTPNQFTKINSTYYICSGNLVGGLYSSTDFNTWTRLWDRPLNFIAFGNGVYVAVSVNGTISYSTNLTTWTDAAVAVDTYRRVKFDGTRFFVHSDTKVLNSTDGINWTSYNSPSGNILNIASSGTVLVATVGDTNTLFIYSSTNNGSSWTKRDGLGYNYSDVNSIGQFCEYLSGYFLIHAVPSVYGVFRSTDGATWTLAGTTSAACNGIAFAPNRGFITRYTSTYIGFFTNGGPTGTWSNAGSIYGGGFDTNYAGRAGGNGGFPAGGGGGGAGASSANAGNGGAGGNGFLRVYSW